MSYRDTIEAMVTGLIAAEKQDMLYLGYMVAALVLEKEADLQWLKERFAMFEDILSDTWVWYIRTFSIKEKQKENC